MKKPNSVLPLFRSLGVAAAVLSLALSSSAQEKTDGAPELFGEHASRNSLLKAVGQAMASGVHSQVIAEAKLAYGLRVGDNEYLVLNLPLFEKISRTFDVTLARVYKTRDEWDEKIAFVRELSVATSPTAASEQTASHDERITQLEKALAAYQRQIEQLQRPADTTPSTPAPPATSAPPRPSDPKLGNPLLWSKVTTRSLGKVFIPGKGWLNVGPNGPIDTGGSQVISRVHSRDEVRARNLAEAAASSGMSSSAYQSQLNQRERERQAEEVKRDMWTMKIQIDNLKREQEQKDFEATVEAAREKRSLNR